MSPTLAGRFLTTEPLWTFLYIILSEILFQYRLLQDMKPSSLCIQ